MVKRRKEEEIAGVLEFEGLRKEAPEFAAWLAEHKMRNGGKVRVDRHMSGTPGEGERPPGFYWISVAGGSPEVAHFVEGEWWLTGLDSPVGDEIEVLIGHRL